MTKVSGPQPEPSPSDITNVPKIHKEMTDNALKAMGQAAAGLPKPQPKTAPVLNPITHKA
jgi:hypothetical protein